ncbi:MAG: hypothetical protein LBQ66_13030 [Planctomycetaceae bacterium]|nr:hypothetical protein [Planctomycetaceae bacterium]
MVYKFGKTTDKFDSNGQNDRSVVALQKDINRWFAAKSTSNFDKTARSYYASASNQFYQPYFYTACSDKFDSNGQNDRSVVALQKDINRWFAAKSTSNFDKTACEHQVRIMAVFDTNAVVGSLVNNLCDVNVWCTSETVANNFDVNTWVVSSVAVEWDLSYSDFRSGSSGRFDVICPRYSSLSDSYDVLQIDRFAKSATSWSVIFGLRAKALNQIPFAPWYSVRVGSEFDVLRELSFCKMSQCFDVLSLQRQLVQNHFSVLPESKRASGVNFFDIYRYVPHVKLTNLFDIRHQVFSKTQLSRYILTLEGWRLILTNTETGERTDLGFVSAGGERVMRDVVLEPGGYELSVLTSSLFWENAVDRKVRTFVVKAEVDEPVLGLPSIMNLRASVSRGVTRVEWNTDLGDYVAGSQFNVWLSATPAVDTNAVADKTILYRSGVTDYSFTLVQDSLLWCVVQPVYADLRGNAAEIVLNWSNTALPRPFDQIATTEKMLVT